MRHVAPASHRRPAFLLLVLALLAFASEPASAQVREFELDTVTVSVESRILPGLGTRALEVVTAAELQTLPLRSITEAVAWAAGTTVDARSAAQADLSIRGSSFEQVVVLVNGIRMSDPQTGHFDLDLAVPLERVERIEILRGPASSLYGADAVGGVVNVVTRAPGEAHVQGRLEGDSFAGRLAAIAGGGRIGGIGLGGGADWSSGDGHRDGTDFDILRLHGEAAASVGGGRLTIAGGLAERSFGADGFYAPFPSYEETATKTLAATWRGSVGGLAIHPRVWRRAHDDDFVLKRADPAFYRNIHASRQTGAALVVRQAVGSRTLVAVGAEWVVEDIESATLGDRKEGRTAAYGEGTVLLDGATLRGGLRLDHYEVFGSIATPSVSASATVNRYVRLRAAAGRAFRAPTWTERYYEDPAHKGRADLGAERTWTLELGADVTLSGPAELAMTAFTRRAEDLIDWARPTGDGSPWETRNVESAVFDGLELTLRGARLGRVTVAASGSVLRLESRATPGLESKYALRPTTRQASLRLRAPLGSRSWAVVRFFHARKKEQSAHTTLDLRLASRFGGGELFLDVRNALDADYMDITRNPAPGRAMSIGIRYNVDLRP